MVGWTTAFGPVVGQHVMARVHDRTKWLSVGREQKARKRKGLGLFIQTQTPPARP